MVLIPDCVRSIMLAVEEKQLGETYRVDTLMDLIPQYSEEEIIYCCLKLNEADYLDIYTVVMPKQNFPGIKSVNELTMKGHEFLEKIRDDSVWAETTEKLNAVGAFALPIIAQVAGAVITGRLGLC